MEEFSKVLGPIGEPTCAEPFDCPEVAVLAHHAASGKNVVFGTRADESQGGGTERELEQAPSERRYVIVVAFGPRLGDDFGLPIGQPHALAPIPRPGLFR